MQKLLELLKDGNSRTLEILANELGMTTEDVMRRMEYLERIGVIRRVLKSFENKECGNCGPCSGCDGCASICKGCIPQNAVLNMGEMWEIV